MPVIPLLNNGNVPLVDTGIRVARTAQLSEGQGAAAWGQALGNISQDLAGIAKEREKANDAASMLELESEMGNLAGQQAQFQNDNPDQESWGGNWTKISAPFAKKLEGARLSRDAQLTMQRAWNRYNQQQTLSIQEQANAYAKDKVKTQVGTRIRMAQSPEEIEQLRPIWKESGLPEWDFDAAALPAQQAIGQRNASLTASAVIKERGAAGVSDANKIISDSPWFSAEEKRDKIAGNAYQAEVEDLKVLAYDDPFMAKELAETKLRGPERIEVTQMSERRIEQVRSANLKAYQEDITTGKVPSLQELESDRYLSEQDRVLVMDYALQGPKNDPVGYSTLYAEAANFQGDESSPEYATLSQRISMALDGDLQAKALSKLSESAKNKDPDALTRSINDVYGLVSEDLKAGRFGTWEVPIQQAKRLPQEVRGKVDALKKTLSTTEGFWNKTTKTEEALEAEARKEFYTESTKGQREPINIEAFTVADEDAKAVAARNAQNVMMALEKWKSDNPKATPQELRAQYDSLTIKFKAASGASANPLIPPIGGQPVDLNQLLLRNANP